MLLRMQDRYAYAASVADEKVALAMSAYDTVDRHIRRLDMDLLKNERSLYAGLRSEVQGTAADDAVRHGTPVPKETDRFSQDGQLLAFWSGLVGLEPLTCLAYLREHIQAMHGMSAKNSATAAQASQTRAGSPEPAKSSVDPADVDPSEPTYCYCDRVSFGEVRGFLLLQMVACDNDDCPLEWVRYLTHPVSYIVCGPQSSAKRTLVLPVLCPAVMEGARHQGAAGRAAPAGRGASASRVDRWRYTAPARRVRFLDVAMSGFMYPTEEARQAGRESDKADLSFVQFYAQLPAPIPGTVRLFDRQEYYTVHGEDALYVANTVFRTQSVLRYLGRTKSDAGLPSCSLNMAAAKSFLRDALTTQQRRIEIWTSTIGDGSGRRSGAWAISKQASPGNLQEIEDLLFLNADVMSSPMVLAMRVKTQQGLTTVGAAFADATNREIGVLEYAENDLFANSEVRVGSDTVAADSAGHQGVYSGCG